MTVVRSGLSICVLFGMLGCGGRCSGAGAQALSLGKDVKLAGMVDVFKGRMQARREWWRPLAFAALLLLAAEWAIYQRATLVRLWVGLKSRLGAGRSA